MLEQLVARCSFPPTGTPVTCAVSGGADSLALLALAVSAGCAVTAVHVDHGLRAGSSRDAEVVAAAATRFGAAFRSERVCVDTGADLEARARAARFAVLPDDVLTGHTADDQAETMLLNLMRGSALDGLAAMRSGRHPLRCLRRRETQALCAELSLAPVVDAMNLDVAFRRNRVRLELMPLLDDIAERDVTAVLARQADLWRDEVDLLDALASEIDATDAPALAAAKPALARRAVRRWLRERTDAETHPPDSAAVERVLAVARGEALACEISPHLRISRTKQRLVMRP